MQVRKHGLVTQSHFCGKPCSVLPMSGQEIIQNTSELKPAYILPACVSAYVCRCADMSAILFSPVCTLQKKHDLGKIIKRKFICNVHIAGFVFFFFPLPSIRSTQRNLTVPLAFGNQSVTQLKLPGFSFKACIFIIYYTQ